LTSIEIDGDRLAQLLKEANQFGALPNGGVQRLAWSEPEVEARAWLLDRCLREGLEADQDQAGNIWAWGGEQPAIVMGSHLDTVPNGGAFDGTLGVLAALEILTTARKARAPHADRLAMVCFTDEEGVRFSTGMTGSRAVAGTLDPAELVDASTADGQRLWDVLLDRGIDPARVPDAAERRPAIAAYLELHIEQGRRLEAGDASVGLVHAIAGLNIWHIHVQGQANHAGTTQLQDRRDALIPAAAAILEARQTMSDLSGLAATVGDVRVENAASNIVPRATQYTVDIRSADRDKIEEATGRILGVIRTSAAENKCHVEVELTKSMPPVLLDRAVLSATKTTSPANKQRPELASMAGHDAMSLAAAGVPCGMIFVRSHHGLSHCPQEHSSVSDCAEGAQHMADAAMLLARDLAQV
jgi:allantoate deiminase